jgi:hypothetical protein
MVTRITEILQLRLQDFYTLITFLLFGSRCFSLRNRQYYAQLCIEEILYNYISLKGVRTRVDTEIDYSKLRPETASDPYLFADQPQSSVRLISRNQDLA